MRSQDINKVHMVSVPCAPPVNSIVPGSVAAVAPAPRSEPGHAGCAVHATDVDRALPLLISELKKLKVPERTVIEELCNGVGSVHRLH